MRKYSMEYYMMNDTTYYCPEWETTAMMDCSEPLNGAESGNVIGKFFREIFG